jgi:thioredoxin-like negative regulator of GroEL
MDGGVEAVPTVVAYKGGQQVDKFVGLVDEDRLDAFVHKLYDE